MTPPKCFFKRPEEFYSNGCATLQHSNQSKHSDHSPQVRYEAYADLFQLSKSKQDTPNVKMEPPESPLDLSCKSIDDDNNDLIQKLGSFLFQHQALLPRLFLQLPPELPAAEQKEFSVSWDSLQERKVDPTLLSVNQVRGGRPQYSPQSTTESTRDNSSSETSSQYATSHSQNRINKRKFDGKVLRPFKLYKGNDSQGLMEALGISTDDEEWLKSVIEYKSVDDVFLFITNCMDEATRPADLTEETVDKIKTRFGHIFQNCNASVSNPRMVRRPDMTPKELKTEEYWDKRRKNNEAAKRSREARRYKEENLNHRCEKLQMENDCLRKEIERVKLRISEIKQSIM